VIATHSPAEALVLVLFLALSVVGATVFLVNGIKLIARRPLADVSFLGVLSCLVGVCILVNGLVLSSST
jgi:hypothetical protein